MVTSSLGRDSVLPSLKDNNGNIMGISWDKFGGARDIQDFQSNESVLDSRKLSHTLYIYIYIHISIQYSSIHILYHIYIMIYIYINI